MTDLEQRARTAANAFANGMFSGHGPLYRDDLETMLARTMRETRIAALEDALAVAETTTGVMRARDAIRAMIERERADG